MEQHQKSHQPRQHERHSLLLATDGLSGNELFRSDGTDVGTFMLRDNQSRPRGFQRYWINQQQSHVVLQRNRWIEQHELWKSNGTAAGTVLVKDISPSGASLPSELTAVEHSFLCRGG